MGRNPSGLLFAVFGTLFLASLPLEAQRFGQWSWYAVARYQEGFSENSVGGEQVGSYDERTLNLSLGLRGFVIHPTIARFRLGGEGSISRFDQGFSRLDTSRLGFAGDLSVFPEGPFPVQISALRQKYDFSRPGEDENVPLLGTPDTLAAYRGRLRIRKGLLTGTIFDASRSVLTFADPNLSDQVDERASIDWSRSQRTLAHHYQLEWRHQGYGAVGLDTRDLTATLDEHGSLSPSWRWDLSGVGISRRLRHLDSTSTYDTVNVRNSFVHPLRDADSLSIGYAFGLFTAGGAGSSQSHEFLLRYGWRLGGGFEISPQAGYTLQKSPTADATIPRAALGVGWTEKVGPLALSATGQVSVGQFRRTTLGISSTETFTGYTVGGSLSAGSDRTIQTAADASWSRNDVRMTGEANRQLPDLGGSLGTGGTEDSLRGRLSLNKAWEGIHVRAYGDYADATSSLSLDAGRTRSQILSSSLDVGVHWVTLVGSIGETRIVEPSEQRIEWTSGSLWLRPWRLLSLNGLYRSDHWRVPGQPTLDTRRMEAGAVITLGDFSLVGRGFRTVESVAGGAPRENRGVHWSVSRGFDGWLPFVSAPQRRGSIR